MVNFCTLYHFQRIMMLELASNLKAYVAQISERYVRASCLSTVIVVLRRRGERRPRTPKKIFKHVRKCVPVRISALLIYAVNICHAM